MTVSKRTLLLLVLLSRHSIAGPEIPGAAQTRPWAIVGATLHCVSSPKIPNGTLFVVDGKISAVAPDYPLPPETEIMDGKNKHVYPGLFNADGSLGLLEINSVRATDDTREVGDFNPNVRAEIAINPDSELIPVTRSGGVLLSLTVPKGGLLAGTSAVLQLDGWTWEEMAVQRGVGMHMNWPDIRDASGTAEEQQTRLEPLRNIENIFDRATAYDRSRTEKPNLPVDVRWEALRPVVQGKMPLIVDAEHRLQIQRAVAFGMRRKLRLVTYGGYDAADCAELLKTAQVPVILAGTYRLPLRRGDPYDHPYTLPSRLKQAGIPYCIAGSSRFDASNIRNLPYHAGVAVAFGLAAEDAIRAITLSPAEILGLADRVGSLQVGKDGTVILTDGEILDTSTHVERAWFQGREVDLADRQKRLWRKYETRINRSLDPKTRSLPSP